MGIIIDKELSTERLNLRRVTLDDVEDMYEYTSDKNNTFFLSWEAHKSKENVIRFIKSTIEEYKLDSKRYTWGIELKEKNKLIGVVSIFDISYHSKRVEVSYILNSSFQGKGYVTEALKGVVGFLLNDLDFIRVQAKCTEDNIPSEKVMMKVGMKYEGKLIKFWNIKNEFKNVLIYAIVK